MKRFPLYTETTEIAAERGVGLDRNPKCGLCPLNREHLRHPCLGGDGWRYKKDEPTLLVVADYPLQGDDSVGRILSTEYGASLRSQIESRWSGSIVYDVGVRCAPSELKPKPDWVNACRPYLTSNVNAIRPARIITLGAYAGRAVLGRQIPPLSMRKGYSFTSYGAPVLMLMSHLEAFSNRFKRQWLLEDLDWAVKVEPKHPPREAVYRHVETADDAREAVADLYSGQAAEDYWVTLDTEWSGLMWNGRDNYYELLCLAITKRGDPNPYLWDLKALNNLDTWGPLSNLLADSSLKKMGQNIKAEVQSCMAKRKYPVNLRGIAGDLLLLRKGLASDIDGSLDFAAELVGMGGHKEENDHYVKEAVERIKYAKKLAREGVQFLPGLYSDTVTAAVKAPHDLSEWNWAYGEVPRPILHRYCARDTVSTDLVADKIWPAIRSDPQIQAVNDNFVKPAVTSFAQVEAWGMGFDRAANKRATKYLATRIERLEKKIANLDDIPSGFNPGSDSQIQVLLYEQFKLPVLKRTKSENPSVDAETLKALADKHPVVSLLVEYGELTTVQNTFAAGMAKFLRGDGRIHTDFRLSGTRSGRLSSGEPNLQNIPSRNPKLAKMIKDCFVASPGRMLIQLDYSQLEYRVAAMLSKDPVFRQIFIDGHDAHRRTAELVAPFVHGVSTADAEKMTDKEIKGWRSDAKKINFGVLYGKTVRTLARDLGCSVEQADKLFNIIMGKFSDLKTWIDKLVAYATRSGMCWTYLVDDTGVHPYQRRQLYNIGGMDDGAASTARNGAINTPIQGTAAGYMNRTVCAVVDWLLADHIPAKVINTVHDSIIEEVDDAYADEVALSTRDIMERWPSDGVPIVADIEIGRTWGSMVGVKRVMEGNRPMWRFKKFVGEETLILHAATLPEVLTMVAA